MAKSKRTKPGCSRCGGELQRVGGLLRCSDCGDYPRHDPRHDAPSTPIGGGRWRQRTTRESEEYERLVTITFTEEEKKKLVTNEEAQRFIADAPDDWSMSYLREQLRERFLRPPTLAKKLHKLLHSLEGQVLVEEVANLERDFAKLTKLRPISELRQESWMWGNHGRESGPQRSVIFWWMTGISFTLVPPRVGYRNIDGEFAFAGCGGTAESGNPTHFSELPWEVAE